MPVATPFSNLSTTGKLQVYVEDLFDDVSAWHFWTVPDVGDVSGNRRCPSVTSDHLRCFDVCDISKVVHGCRISGAQAKKQSRPYNHNCRAAKESICHHDYSANDLCGVNFRISGEVFVIRIDAIRHWCAGVFPSPGRTCSPDHLPSGWTCSYRTPA